MSEHRHDCPQCGARMKKYDTVYPGVCTPCMRINSSGRERNLEATAGGRAAEEKRRLKEAILKGLVSEDQARPVMEYFESIIAAKGVADE
jgi:hypothetical protein